MVDDGLAPEVTTKKQLALDWLRERIVAGELGPGERVRQQDVAARLRISSTPVREAILQLEVEGYLESVPHVGSRVSEFNAGSQTEVAELRQILEGRLARAAAESISDQQLRELVRLHRTFQLAVESADSLEARRANFRFHRLVWDASQLVVTQQVVQALWAKVPWRNLDDISGRGLDSLVEHEALVAALSLRDPDAAERATYDHIESSHRHLLSRRESGIGPETSSPEQNPQGSIANTANGGPSSGLRAARNERASG